MRTLARLAALAAAATLPALAATACSRGPNAAAATPEDDARFVSLTLARSTVFQAGSGAATRART